MEGSVGSAAGVAKTAARRSGLTPEEYEARRAAGLKRCVACREWRSIERFGNDATRGDGRSATCLDCGNERSRVTYRPVPLEERLRLGPPRIAARDGDRKQARARINADVDGGLRPDPNDLFCALCGHKGPDRRHEYHHAMGYAPEHHNDVLALCTRCHHAEHPR